MNDNTKHQIRLGPPWVVAPANAGARHARKFGAPRTLDATERLWLVCALVPGAHSVVLNGIGIGTSEVAGPFATDITDQVRPRNEIVFEVSDSGALGPVVLEIRSATL